MSLLTRKVRGFRLVDLIALGVLMAIILGVYLGKTLAGSERSQIASVERQIAEEQARIRLLQAEVSHLEQPARIERLSEAYLGLGPVAINRETSTEGLSEAVRGAPAAGEISPVAREAKVRAAMALAAQTAGPAQEPAPEAGTAR